MGAPEVEASIEQLLARLEELAAQDRLHRLSPGAVRRLMTAAVKAYVAQVHHRAVPEAIPAPVDTDAGLTPTDLMIAVNEMLKAADLNVFELEMFRVMGSY